MTKAMDLVLKQPRKNGMFPNFVDMNTGSLQSSDYRLGAMGDSFYECVDPSSNPRVFPRSCLVSLGHVSPLIAQR